MNIEAVVRHYRAHFQSNVSEMLESFRLAPTLEEAVHRAALAQTPDGKRYSHQRRLRLEDLERAEMSLSSRIGPIADQPNFARLHELVENALRAESGLGALYLYDTALRIGAKTGHLPTRVYLHAGTRAGALALGLDAKQRKALDKSEIPAELRVMEMYEVEEILCIYKRLFSGEVSHVDDARACWSDEADEIE